MKILIFGSGYIGDYCWQAWSDAVMADRRIKTFDDVLELLERHQPDVVLNAAGVVGKPNVDWCETHQEETFAGNVALPWIIALACQSRGIYMLHVGSGCVFYGDAPHEGPWSEDDFANPGAVYTKSKYAADLMLSTLDSPPIGIARIRMPLDSRPLPNNIIDKLVGYPEVIDVANSLTVLEDMAKVFYQLLEKRAAGIFHVVNPGTIKHKEIIAWYEELVDPEHHNEWISESDLVARGWVAKKRSTNVLGSKRLAELGIEMRPVKEAVYDAILKYAKNKLEK